MTYNASFSSPVGIVEVTATNTHITSVLFVEEPRPETERSAVLTQAIEQLQQYFRGERTTFTVPYEQQGTAFQQRVWQALTTVPYGEMASYKQIATLIDNEKAVRAVGMTNSKNQLTILVPCHRIIGSSGKLTGYTGGVWRKQWLLEHERGGTS